MHAEAALVERACPQRASEDAGSLLHPEESAAGAVHEPVLAAGAVIDDIDDEHPAAIRDGDIGGGIPGLADDVGERLLHDTVRTESRLRGSVAEVRLTAQPGDDAGGPGGVRQGLKGIAVG